MAIALKPSSASKDPGFLWKNMANGFLSHIVFQNFYGGGILLILSGSRKDTSVSS